MKRLKWIVAFLVIIGAIGFLGPWILKARDAEPLMGVFDVELKCMGGHEIFLELTEDAAFDNCPGHRDRKKVASIIRDTDSVTVIDSRDGRPWFRVHWDGTKHTLDFLKRPDSQSMFGMIPVRGEVLQVNNPWRIWIPLMLPEH